jgi:hypothetical protein
MSKPRVRIINHYTRDEAPSKEEVSPKEEMAGWDKQRRELNAALAHIQSACKQLSQVQMREQLPALRSGMSNLKAAFESATKALGSNDTKDNSPFTPKAKPDSVRFKGEAYFIVDEFGDRAVYENDDEDEWVVSGLLGLSGPFSTRSAARAAAKG